MARRERSGSALAEASLGALPGALLGAFREGFRKRGNGKWLSSERCEGELSRVEMCGFWTFASALASYSNTHWGALYFRRGGQKKGIAIVAELLL